MQATLWRTLGAAAFCSLICATTQASDRGNSERKFAQWLLDEEAKAKLAIAQNIAPVGTPPGFVVASPSKTDPNYFFHWTRDSALTMAAVVELYAHEADARAKERYAGWLIDYLHFTREVQQIDTLSGRVSAHHANVGEPKFNVDGSGFTGTWGRPQADGPALRATTFLRFMGVAFLPDGTPREDRFESSLYYELLDAVQVDLDYVVYHGLKTSFDIWEEIRGHHFYTEMVQREALNLGADIAAARGDQRTARRYRQAARVASRRLARHWDGHRGYLVETRGRDGGIDYKDSNLDTAVVLGALHASDGFFAPGDERVLATAARLRRAFARLYPINRVTVDDDGLALQSAIGRYPEDLYDGAKNEGGNPWVLLTLAMAELDYRVVQQVTTAGELKITRRNIRFFEHLISSSVPLRVGEKLRAGDTDFKRLLQDLMKDGDAYLARVHYHAAPSGELSEQIDRYTGAMTSAYDLTWSYAGYLTALQQRRNANVKFRLVFRSGQTLLRPDSENTISQDLR